jgi:hypothetical protein
VSAIYQGEPRQVIWQSPAKAAVLPAFVRRR